MNEDTLVYLIIALFLVNVAGIHGVWGGIEAIVRNIDDLKQRLTRLETEFKNYCKGGEKHG